MSDGRLKSISRMRSERGIIEKIDNTSCAPSTLMITTRRSSSKNRATAGAAAY